MFTSVNKGANSSFLVTKGGVGAEGSIATSVGRFKRPTGFEFIIMGAYINIKEAQGAFGILCFYCKLQVRVDRIKDIKVS